MTVHTDEELRRDSRLARTAMRAGLMSDAKWRKLCAALEAAAIPLRDVFIKFIDVDLERPITWFSGHAPTAWIDTFEHGPVSLRSIEWIRFPQIVEAEAFERLAAQLRPSGRFPIELTKEGLVIRGYLAKED